VRCHMLVATASYDRTARLWIAETGQCVVTLIGHKGEVNSVSFSPDGQLVVTASDDKTARIWTVEGDDEHDSGRRCTPLVGHDASVSSAVFSPDGESVVTASADGTARIWTTDGGSCLRTFEMHERYLISSAWSPDSQYLAFATSDDSELALHKFGRPSRESTA